MTTQINQLTELTTTSDDDLILIREDSTGIDKKMKAQNIRAKATTKADVGLSNVDNVSAADLRDRSTHTGTQTLATISDAGTIASQNANAVSITGGTINNTPIGGTTASTGAFTTLAGSTSVTSGLDVSAGRDVSAAQNLSAGAFRNVRQYIGLSRNVWTNVPDITAAIDGTAFQGLPASGGTMYLVTASKNRPEDPGSFGAAMLVVKDLNNDISGILLGDDGGVGLRVDNNEVQVQRRYAGGGIRHVNVSVIRFL